MGDAVRYELRGPTAWLSIDREDRRNALSDDVIDGLLAGLAAAEGDPDVRAVVVTGAGDRAFCAGGDLAGNLAPDEGRVRSHDRRGALATLLKALAHIHSRSWPGSTASPWRVASGSRSDATWPWPLRTSSWSRPRSTW